MRRQLEHAFGFPLRPGYPERTHQFPQAHHLEVFVDQYQIERKKHSDGVDRVCWDNPHSTVWLQRALAQQANQPPKNRVSYLNPEGKKRLLRLVVDKNVPLLLGHTRPSSKFWQLRLLNEALFSSSGIPA